MKTTVRSFVFVGKHRYGFSKKYAFWQLNICVNFEMIDIYIWNIAFVIVNSAEIQEMCDQQICLGSHDLPNLLHI